MSIAVVYSRVVQGINAPLVSVEVHIGNGLPGILMVGLAETSVRESRERVRSALITNQYQMPSRRITVNLAPADISKQGGRFDLPIAIGILAASGQIPADTLEHYELLGELSLTGEIRSVRGVMPSALLTRQAGRSLICPESNRREAELIRNVDIYPAASLEQVCSHLGNEELLPRLQPADNPVILNPADNLADIHGQEHAKRALEISAAGEHSLLLIGPPGTGKTMLATRLAGILPPMTEEEAQETAALQSLTRQGFLPEHWKQRPFRSPHHTCTAAALTGGGPVPQPGEISLAHNGVMFLDELPEFDRKALEILREPMESGLITISRLNRVVEFPARFQLICAMNPCPCGYLGDRDTLCRCTEEQVRRYQQRISGPLLDRLDIQLVMPRVPLNKILQHEQRTEVDSAAVQQRVRRARDRQLERNNTANARMNNADIDKHCGLDDECRELLVHCIEKLKLSNRAYYKVLRVARTIADLELANQIKKSHLVEAISYRQLEKKPALT